LGNPVTFKGKEYPNSGAQGGVKQRMAVVDKAHPIMQGVSDGFEIVDETYLCPYAEDAVQPLLRTDFKPIDVNFPGRYAKGWRHPEVPGGNLAGWVKVAGRSPIAYLQNGHDRQAWENPAYRTMLMNADSLVEFEGSEGVGCRQREDRNARGVASGGDELDIRRLFV
jgi:uncharacterized protein